MLVFIFWYIDCSHFVPTQNKYDACITRAFLFVIKFTVFIKSTEHNTYVYVINELLKTALEREDL